MRKFKRTTFPFWYMMGLGFINIFDGLIVVLTLGQYTSQWQFQYVMKWHRKQAIKRKKNENKTY